MSNPVQPSTPPKALKPIDEFRQALTKGEGEIKKALPPHITAEKFNRVVITALQNNPSLLDLNRASLFNACMKAAADGLLPDGKEAALVPFQGNIQYTPMIGGILKKIRNSGELASITSQVIHKNDKFRYWVDIDGEHIEHEPLLFGDRGEAIGVYALAKTKDGAIYIEPMTKEQVMAVKKVSRAKAGPWSGDFEHEMWKKTAMRRLSKRLPMSTDLEQVIHRDDELYDLEGKEEKTEAPPQQTKSSRLSRIVEAQQDVEEADTVEHKDSVKTEPSSQASEEIPI